MVAYKKLTKDERQTISRRMENSRNSLSNLQIMASFMPGFLWKCYYPVLACGVVSQFYKIDYRGNIKHVDNPLFKFDGKKYNGFDLNEELTKPILLLNKDAFVSHFKSKILQPYIIFSLFPSLRQL